MNESHYTGEWFLPENDNRIQGRLLFNKDEKVIVLELFGKDYLEGVPVIIKDPNRDKRYHSPHYNTTHQVRHPLILGDTHSLITLYNCEFAGLKSMGSDLHCISYKAVFVFFGAHINAVEKLLIVSATFYYPYLPSWYGGAHAVNPLHKEQNNPATIPDFMETRISPAIIPVKDGLKLIISEAIIKSMPEVGVHHESRYRMSAEWEYEKPIPFLDMLKDAAIFGNLMSYSLGTPLCKMLTEISISKQNLEKHARSFDNAKTVCLFSSNYSLQRGQEAKAHSMHQNYMLFSNWNMKQAELNRVILTWFSNHSLFSIYDYYLDSNNWFRESGVLLSRVMFYNRFLNIVQALEAYYTANASDKKKDKTKIKLERDTFNQQKNEALKKLNKDTNLKKWLGRYKFNEPKESLEMKMKNLIISLNPVLSAIFGQSQIIDFFPRYASKVRNHLSHGKNEIISEANVLQLYFHTGQILLAICILESLKIERIADKIQHYDTFARYIQQINSTELNFI